MRICLNFETFDTRPILGVASAQTPCILSMPTGREGATWLMSKTVDSLPRRAHRRRAKATESENGIRRRSPLEQAIAESADRRVRYESKMREEGFKRTTIWVRADYLGALQTLVKVINGTDGKNQVVLQQLVETLEKLL